MLIEKALKTRQKESHNLDDSYNIYQVQWLCLVSTICDLEGKYKTDIKNFFDMGKNCKKLYKGRRGSSRGAHGVCARTPLSERRDRGAKVSRDVQIDRRISTYEENCRTSLEVAIYLPSCWQVMNGVDTILEFDNF